MSGTAEDFEAFVKRVFDDPGVTIASVRRATAEEIESKRRWWDQITNATQTDQLPPEPRPETFPRFVPEMPRTPGVAILTETPIGIGLGAGPAEQRFGDCWRIR